MTKKICIFCSSPIIKKRVISKNGNALAFLTNIPITTGHTLVIPKRCVSRIDELTEEEMKDLMRLVKKVRILLVKSQKAIGFNYAWNECSIAGQSINHLHIHVIPRTKNDSGVQEVDIRKYLYRPGSRTITEEKELEIIADKMKNTIKK